MNLTHYMIPCLFKKFFGFDCPGCGGQRALLYLFEGDFGKAFLIYPAIYPLLIFAGLVLGNAFFPFKHYSKLAAIFSILSVGAILSNYFYKLALLF